MTDAKPLSAADIEVLLDGAENADLFDVSRREAILMLTQLRDLKKQDEVHWKTRRGLLQVIDARDATIRELREEQERLREILGQIATTDVAPGVHQRWARAALAAADPSLLDGILGDLANDPDYIAEGEALAASEDALAAADGGSE